MPRTSVCLLQPFGLLGFSRQLPQQVFSIRDDRRPPLIEITEATIDHDLLTFDALILRHLNRINCSSFNTLQRITT
jgi:hypothetical protein